MMKRDLAYWVAFNKIGFGPVSFEKIIDFFPDLQKAWESSGYNLQKIGIDKRITDRFINERHYINPEKELTKIKKLGHKIWTVKDKNYPKNLLEIPKPPPILFCLGNFKNQDEISLGVVGTRKLTSYGKRVTEKITYGLAKNGLTIISGLALGIDTIAHKTALSAGGRTIAILGTSLDNIYPYTNIRLAREIAKNGALISEFPLGTQGYRGNFPQRNRIISGLSLGVLVIEAAVRSGALITAHYALEQNREVFAIPGSVYNPQSEGCNNLIKMGARLVTNHRDILDELNIVEKCSDKKGSGITLETKTEKIIYNVLDFDRPIHIDKISQITNLDIVKVSSALILMEMKGAIKNLGAQSYIKK